MFRSWKFGTAMLALLLLGSCGGGGGGDAIPPVPDPVSTGFAGDLDWSCVACAGSAGSAGEGVGAGGDGDGGVGAGGDFGQFRNTLVIVRFPDGRELGRAKTDTTRGMVTIRPGAYQGPLIVELQGGDGAQYFEEGLDTFVDFPAGRSIRVVVPYIDKNIGITPFTEAAFRKLQGDIGAGATPTGAQVLAANDKVKDILNQQFPATLSVDDITRLPFIKSPSIAEGTIGTDPRGRYGLVNGAFSKQAAMFNRSRTQPTLDAVEQLANDLRDGVLDGMNGTQPAVAANARTYDPNTLTGELTSALAQQSFRFGTDVAKGALPKVLNFGNTRYQGYLFDASLTADGKAFDTVAGWVGDNSLGRQIGQPIEKMSGTARVFGVYGNHGHGSVFFKTDATDSAAEVFAVGDNVNGELGTGGTTATASAVKITLPGVLTHIAGGFAHTVARFADGSVYAWGDNSFGQLGNGTNTASTTPVAVSLPRGAVAVAATNTASYALLDDGSVYAWGTSGGFGLLGDGDKNSARNTPAPITSLSQVVQIAARDNDVAVVRKDGSIWHWGSFPADETAFTAGDPTLPYAGGSPLPQQVAGLPAGVAVRKVLTEQGVFAALLEDGTVWEWGVYFDITAQQILRDLEAHRVLSLPPIRDMMPGGFIGYGVRPFDRLTAMGVDYRGGMWKIRGRVAEEFDPAHPQLQRRPQGQAPRPDCQACHIFLNDWPLTPDAPTSTDVCVPPPDIHGTGATSLIHAETACEKCHNPNRQPPAAAFPNGWITCVKPSNLPPRSSPTSPPIITTACTIPAGHSFTPPGTVCASCHNSIIARPLQDLGCAQPQSSALPTIVTTATIVTAVNDGNSPIAAGASTTDTTPTLSGTLSAGLQTGQSLRVMRNGASIGTFTTLGTTNWTFTDPGAGNGLQAYTARVEAGSGFGRTSNSYAITIDTVAPTQTITIAFADDVVGAISSPGFTSDTTPTVTGTLSAVLASGETVRVFRGGVAIATLTPAGTTWSYTEPTALTGATYSYTARVVDAAGNLGPLSAAGSLTVVTDLPTATITGAVNDGTSQPIVAGGFTNDTTPVLQGSLSAALSSGQLVRVLRDGTSIGTVAPAAPATTWSLTDPGAGNGAHTYTARTEQGTVFSSSSAGFSFTVDNVAPTQTANVTQISDDISGNLANGASTSDTTPTIAGNLSAALGANESLQVLRGGVVITTLVPAGTSWTYTEPSPLAPATYSYSARVVDAAGNVSVAAGTTRSVTVDTSFPLAGASTTLATINNVSPTNGAVPLNNDSTPTLAGTISRNLAGDEWIRIYRNGVAVGTTTTGTLAWSFTSGALADGTYTFVARIEKTANANQFGQPSASISDPIDATAPSQTLTVTATSDVAPNSTVAGAIPASNVISGLTNDPSPTITIVLGSALGSGETLTVTRQIGAGSATTVATFTSPSGCAPSGRCFQFTNDSGLSIPVPPARLADALGANSPNTSLPSSTYTYTARVSDNAGNQGTNTGSAAFQFGYFNCHQARADATYGSQFPGFTHSIISAASNPTNNCSGCHRTSPAGSAVGGTPAGTFVAVPPGNPSPDLPSAYWCKRPN